MSNANAKTGFETAMTTSLIRRLGACCAALLFLALPALGHAQTPFPSAEAAADAFVDAVARSDEDAMRSILGANKTVSGDEYFKDPSKYKGQLK